MGDWTTRKLGDFLKPYRIEHIVQDDTYYRQVKISKNHGISFRGSMIGKSIGRKRQFIIDLKTYPNTALFTRQGIRDGAIGIAPLEVDKCIVTENMPMMSVDTNLIEMAYLKKLLLSEYLYEKIRLLTVVGSAQKSIHERDFLNIAIELPHIKIQETECKRFNSLDAEHADLKTELTHQQTLLKKLRQQILQEAIEGKLTANWREQNPDAEPASELLTRILAEKAQLIKDKKIKKQKSLPPISEEEKPFELPDGWVWCRLIDLCSKTGSGSTPSGGKSVYANSGVKFIRSQNVYNDGFRWNGEAYISKLTHQKMIGTSLKSKDLLLNITGGSIGRCCILPEDFDDGNINQHVAILRIVFPEHGAYYIHSVVCSSYFQAEIINAQTGAGREGLPKNKMDNILIPLPPLPEQKAIVTKVEKLLTLCDQLEIQITDNQTHAKQLMQAVLKEAFSRNV